MKLFTISVIMKTGNTLVSNINIRQNITYVESSLNESREVTTSKRRNNHVDLDEISKLPTKKKQLNKQDEETESDDDSNSNRSENEEDDTSDVTQDNADLKSYFLEICNFVDLHKRLSQDMDKICANDRLFWNAWETCQTL